MARVSSLALLATGREICSGLLARPGQGLSPAGLTTVQLAPGSMWQLDPFSYPHLQLSALRGLPMLTRQRLLGVGTASGPAARSGCFWLGSGAGILGSCGPGLLTSTLLTCLPRTS